MEKKLIWGLGDEISYTMPKIGLRVLEVGAWNPTLFPYLVRAGSFASVGRFKMLRGVFVVRVVVVACLQR